MLTEHKHIVEDVAYVLFLYIVDNFLISYGRPKGTEMGDGDGGAGTGTIFFVHYVQICYIIFVY